MRIRTLSAALVAAAVVLPLAASASDPFESAAGVGAWGAVDVLATEAVQAAAPVADAVVLADPPFGRAIAPERLDGLRGGDGNVSTTTNRANLNGRVNGNTATNVVGGGNLVSDGSFGNAAGISTVIQNSGSNVLIQNSTIVNVQFVDPTR